MIVVHDIFIAKPGCASKLAKMMKEAMSGNTEFIRVMTDVTGQYNRVIMESQYDNLTAYEESFKQYTEGSEKMKEMKEKMAGYHDLFQSGCREIYRVG